ncbi:alpha/beta hydrolase [Virgibacillus sediminis]|uniref:Alpha/beta hydrolase n=1 Tax=Virgibacillus sediminis TaxID=202260 RepID=A0ABV7AA56_9BACI
MTERYPVLSGAESFFMEGGQTGVLISHGFMGTPQSVRFIGEKLAREGYTVLAPRLKGHGTSPYELEKCTYHEWYGELERGYKELRQHCSRVFVLGQSMGGTLSLWLARNNEGIDGVILVNPALTIPSYEHLRKKTVPRFLTEGEPDIKAKGVHEITFDSTPLKSIQELQKLMDLTPGILPEITCPVLGIKSKEDHVVPPQNTDYILEHIASPDKQKVVLNNSYHVASMDHDKGKIVEGTHDFIQQTIGQDRDRKYYFLKKNDRVDSFTKGGFSKILR